MSREGHIEIHGVENVPAAAAGGGAEAAMANLQGRGPHRSGSLPRRLLVAQGVAGSERRGRSTAALS